MTFVSCKQSYPSLFIQIMKSLPNFPQPGRQKRTDGWQVQTPKKVYSDLKIFLLLFKKKNEYL